MGKEGRRREGEEYALQIKIVPARLAKYNK